MFWRIGAVLSALVLTVLAVFSFREPAKLPAPPTSDELVSLLPLVLPPETNEQEVGCMALALYHEARGDGWAGMEAVAHVIRNRAEASGYPNSVCAVIKQGGETPPCQFSWWCDGRSDNIRNLKMYRQAEDVAVYVLTHPEPDPTFGATSFHATRITPYWAAHMEETATIGGHVFYRDSDLSSK